MGLQEQHSAHDGVEFQPWKASEHEGKLPTTAGSYYLAEDVTLTETWTVPTGTTNLCLNGCTITQTSYQNGVIEIYQNATLNLYDCDETEHFGHIDGTSHLWVPDEEAGEHNISIFGGCLTGGTGTQSLSNNYGGGVFVKWGAFNMYGGNIVGNTSENGGGVFVHPTDGTFTMTGGAIIGNTATDASWSAGGVYVGGDNVIVGGTAKITDNFKVTGEGAVADNLYVLTTPINRKIALGEGTGSGKNGVAVPTSKMQIGVTTATVPQAGTPVIFTSNGTADDIKYFTSDNDAYDVEYNASGCLQLVIPQEEQHTTHDGIEFQPWKASEHDGALLPNVAGSWYLTDNVTVNANWNVPAGTTNLCLNGKVLGLSQSNIQISESATLNLYDCGNDAHEGYLDEYHLWTLGTGVQEGSTAKTIYGGIIYPEYYGEYNNKTRNTVQVDGTFNMYGGTIAGVIDTQAQGFAAAIVGTGHFAMYGGTITGNSSQDYMVPVAKNVGIINIGTLASVTIGKDAVIDENYIKTYDYVKSMLLCDEYNLVIPAGKTITLDTGDYAPTEKMHVGVRSVTAPVLGTPVVFTGANAGENDASRFESNAEGIHIERRKNNALYLCVADEPPYVLHECVNSKQTVTGQAATCTEDGWNDHYKCTTCETLYSDEAMTTEITDLAAWKVGDGKIEKTGHDFAYSASGNVITATCNNNNEHKVTLTLTKNTVENYYVYDNSAKTVDFASGEAVAWTGAGLELPTITYTAKSGSTLTDSKAVNAGSYTATVTVNADQTATLDFTIAKATPTVTTAPTASAITYGQTLADSNLSNGTASVAGTFAWTTSTTAPAVSDSSSTEYDVIFTPTDTTNYNTVICKVKVEVNQADGSGSVTMQGWTYGETANDPVPTSDKNGTGSVTYAYKVKDAADSTYTVTKPENAGTYTVKATFAATENYKEATATADFTIAKKEVEVVWTNTSLTYDATAASAQLPSASYTNVNGGSTALTVTTTATNGDAGTYTATAAFSNNDSAKANYTLKTATVTQEYTVAAKMVASPTITLSADSSPYTGSEIKPTVTVKDGDTVIPVAEYTVSYSDNLNAGTATVTVTDQTGGNYTVSGSTTFTITKVQLTVTAKNKSIVFGNAAANDGVNYSGFVNGETEADLGGDLTYTYQTGGDTPTAYTTSSPVGTYDIIPGGLTSDNYEITFKKGTLTVTELAETAPAANEGYTLDYTAETLKAKDGYEVSSSNETVTTLTDHKVTPGATYYVRKTATDTNHANSAWATITVPARPTTPNTTVASTTANSITVTAVEGAEYKLDNGSWQDSNVFNGLTEASSHTVSVRVKAVANTSFASEAQTIENVYTNAATPASVAETGTISYAEETFELKDGYEISKSNDPFTKGTLTDDKLAIAPSTTYYIRKAAVSGGAGSSEAISLTIPARPAAPNAPVLSGKTDTTVVVKAITGQEYSKDGGTSWVSGTDGKITFTGFSANSAYSIITRVKATDTAFKSENSAALTGTTKASAGSAPGAAITAQTTASITVTPNAAWQYSIDNGANWQDSNEFTGLTAGTEYTVKVRVKETDTTMASNEATLTTGTKPTAPASTDGYTINYTAETIGVETGYEVGTLSGGPAVFTKLTGDTIAPNTVYAVRKAASGNVPASDYATFTTPARPATPSAADFTVTKESVMSKKDGTFGGITANMEYSTDGGTTWTPGPAMLSKFSNETVKVRVKATDAAFKSEEYTYTFTPSTAKLTVTMGESTEQVAYGATVDKPADPTRTGYTFGGWYADEECTKAWNFAIDTVKDNMTLYPKWIRNAVQKAAISGNVKQDSSNVSGATVELYLGTVKVAATVTNESGNYNFDNVENGTYNIVVTNGEKTKTALVTVNNTGSFSVDVMLPASAVNSIVEVENTKIDEAKSEISQTVVGGLDTIAAAQTPGVGQTITIKLTVEPKADTGTAAQQEIKQTAGDGKKVEFLDMSLWQITTTDGGSEASGNIGSSNTQLLTIVIPFDFTDVDVSSVMILRKHGTGNAEKLTKNPAFGQEGFTVDEQTGTITIYAMKFSDYALAYEEEQDIPYVPVTPTYSITGANTENGKLTVNKKNASAGSIVTITVAPDEGYKLDTLTVKDAKGNVLTLTKVGDTTYTFKMPSSKVTISAAFAKIGACPQDETCVYAKFTDTDTKAWYHDGVHFCVENGYMQGVSATAFDPSGTTTRAMIVTMLWRMEGEPVVNYAMSFKDVKADQWYTEAIRWAQSTGVVEGYSAESFDPNDPITREQMATILYRYAKYHKLDVANANTLTGFTDVNKVSAWALDAMKWANAVGLVQGRTTTTLVPEVSITRAEAATMVQRYCEKVSDK